jgi:phage terminase small subunit
VQYERAAKHVAEHGAILPPKNKRTKVGQWNPFWSVMRQADKAILALEAELGLSPVCRGKAEKVQRGKTKPARQTRSRHYRRAGSRVDRDHRRQSPVLDIRGASNEAGC